MSIVYQFHVEKDATKRKREKSISTNVEYGDVVDVEVHHKVSKHRKIANRMEETENKNMQ